MDESPVSVEGVVDPPEGGPPGLTPATDYPVEQALEFWKRWCVRYRAPLTPAQQVALDKAIKDLTPGVAAG